MFSLQECGSLICALVTFQKNVCTFKAINVQKDKEERSPARYFTHKGLEHAHEIHKSAHDNTKEASTRSQACPAILLSPLMCALVVNKKGVKKKQEEKLRRLPLWTKSKRRKEALSHIRKRGGALPPPTSPPSTHSHTHTLKENYA